MKKRDSKNNHLTPLKTLQTLHWFSRSDDCTQLARAIANWSRTKSVFRRRSLDFENFRLLFPRIKGCVVVVSRVAHAWVISL